MQMMEKVNMSPVIMEKIIVTKGPVNFTALHRQSQKLVYNTKPKEPNSWIFHCIEKMFFTHVSTILVHFVKKVT